VLAKRQFFITVLEGNVPIQPLEITTAPKAANVALYPNPANDNVTLKFENIEGDAKVRIINLNGQLVLEQPIVIAKEDVKINLTDIKPGFYFVNVISNDAVITRKLVVEPK
jgi:hypothetical protein